MTKPPPSSRRGITDAGGEHVPNVDTNRFRRARFRMLVDEIEAKLGDKPLIRVLDIGGTRGFWLGVRDLWQHLPLDITIVNLETPAIDEPPFRIRQGNACNLSEHADGSFDFVHSNSVIEHVGHWKDMRAMADEIRRLAPHHFIQTPNFWFPLEPHYRTLFFHWYPEIVRARMLARKKRGFRAKEPSIGAAVENVQTVNLLARDQMRSLFPDSRIESEKVMLLTKSLMAIR
jgi:hypothetical protein